MKGIDGYSVQEFAQIMTKFEDILTQKIIREISEEYSLDLGSLEAAKALLDVAITKGITEGMKMGTNRYYLYDVVGQYPEYHSSDIPFEVGLGVCGILTPDGSFLKCNNAEHHKLVSNISLETQHRCIYFTSFCDGVRIEGNISVSPNFEQTTKEQLQWIKTHLHFFDEGQKRCFFRLSRLLS